jgi:phage gp29-like protein
MAILDASGRPYPSQPRKPVDVAGIAHVPNPGQRWAQALGAISPEKLFHILGAAARGDHEQYLTLAQEMEEKYLHYSSQLQTRKLAITGEEIEVLPGDESELAQTVADDFKRFVVDKECFPDMILDLLDALAKNYSVIQPHWDTTVRPWVPCEYEHLDPRYFKFDQATLTELRLRDDASGAVNGQPLPPGLIVHRPRLRTGVTCRGGLARPAAVAYLFQSASLSQWAVFCDTFGMPLRIGRYDSASATEDEIAQLRTAVINIGHNAAALLPLGMQIDALDVRRPTSGDNVFEGFTTYWNDQISKLIVGQTMTADSGSSRAQADVHDRVRLDIKRSDARQVVATLRRDLATPWTLWNFGPNAPVPRLSIAVDPPEDLKALSEALAPLLIAGLRVRAQEVRDRFGFAAPEAGDEVIEPPAPPPAPGGAPPKPPVKKPKQRVIVQPAMPPAPIVINNIPPVPPPPPAPSPPPPPAPVMQVSAGRAESLIALADRMLEGETVGGRAELEALGARLVAQHDAGLTHG